MKNNNQKINQTLSINKRAAMVAALKTAFVILLVVYGVFTAVLMTYYTSQIQMKRSQISALESTIQTLKTERTLLENTITSYDKTIGDMKKEIETKDSKLTQAQSRINKLENRIDIAYVETKNTKYDFEPYFYAMQSTKFNNHFLTEEQMILVLENAKKYNIDPNLVLGIMWVESRYNPKAKSKVSSASGYGQFIKATGKWTHEYLLKRKDKYDHTKNPFNPKDAIPMMFAYLDHLIKRNNGDIKTVLIRYNGNELGKKYYQMIDKYFSQVTTDVSLESIERNIKINYQL